LYFALQFHQKESSYVEMDFILARGSSLGLYARKNAIPTLPLNDVKDVLTGFRSAATIYSVAPSSTSRREARSLVCVLFTLIILTISRILLFSTKASTYKM
jgi:hypothetical protein